MVYDGRLQDIIVHDSNSRSKNAGQARAMTRSAFEFARLPFLIINLRLAESFGTLSCTNRACSPWATARYVGHRDGDRKLVALRVQGLT